MLSLFIFALLFAFYAILNDFRLDSSFLLGAYCYFIVIFTL